LAATPNRPEEAGAAAMLCPVCRLLLPALPFVLCAALAWGPEAGQSAPAPVLTKRFTNSVRMKLVRIPAGKFWMGSPNDEPNRFAEEHRHEVQITRPFFLGVYTVTQAQYQKVMGTNPSSFSPTGVERARVGGADTADFSVETVSWNDADAFCKKLSALPAEKGARRVYRLPTEAQWEYACRAGTTTAYHFGKTLAASQANFSGRGMGRTCKVGSYKPNAWGLFDMHGNVWQFTADWHDTNYYKVSPRKDPPGPKAGAYRVVRGGSCNNPSPHCRAAFRTFVPPTATSYVIGFRVACDVGGRR
jgi:formylglycine-generating enzyme required for sulfatase activity